MISINLNLQPEKRFGYLKLAAEELKKGKIAILPTSTIYGISCVYDNAVSVNKVYEIKKRPQSLPFIILLPDISHVEMFAEEVTAPAKILIEKYWKPISEAAKPGKYTKTPDLTFKNLNPLTLVFKRKKISRKQKSPAGSDKTIALRIDPLEILLPILSICGPVISTSATLSGVSSNPQKIKDIPDAIRKDVDLIVDCGLALPGLPSTIIDVTGNVPLLLREGKLKYSEILALL
ncbi:MAG: L-threonylcarbamoyladenylate synthase [Actinobacteria bacterium]|nr:L-threonylcarbamoyladenylate synthase [Actinomycetota bacterium]